MKDLRHLIKKCIESLDKTTVSGLAEAIGLAMSGLVDEKGRVIRVQLSNDPSENMFLLEQLASMLLGEKK